MIWLEDVIAEGHRDSNGIEVVGCDQVVLSRCNVLPSSYYNPFLLDKWNGGKGLDVTASNVYAFDSRFAGRDGTYPAYGGGNGARFHSGRLFASRTQFQGGDGGGYEEPCYCVNNGGVGLRVETAPPEGHQLLDCTFIGGAHGWSTCPFGWYCGDADPLAGPGIEQLAADGLDTYASSAVTEGKAVHVNLAGPPSAPAFLGRCSACAVELERTSGDPTCYLSACRTDPRFRWLELESWR